MLKGDGRLLDHSAGVGGHSRTPSGLVPVPRVPADDAVPVRRHDRPLRRWMRRYVAAAVVADVLAAVLAGGTAQVVRFGTDVAPTTVVALGLLPVAWVAAVLVTGGYAVRDLGNGNEEFRSVFRAGVVLLAGIALVSYAGALELSRAVVLIAVPVAVLGGFAGRYALRRRLHHLRAQGYCLRTVVAVGRERAVLDLVRQLRRDRNCGMDVVAACVPDPARADVLRADGVEVVGDLHQVAAAVRRLGADAVAVTSSSETAAVYLRSLSWELEGMGVELLVAPGLMEVAGPRMHMRPFIGLPLVHVEEPSFTGPKRLVKGAMDRSVSVLLLLVLLPLLLALALAVRLQGPGPVLFRQQRIGLGGTPFTMLKFRTMVVGADDRRADLADRNQNADGLLFKVPDDPRVTPVGRVLRRLSLDELPQLLNVVSGRMSLVGPRPPLPAEAAMYDTSVRRRLLVKPGLTGLWQVSGRSDLTWDEAVRLDLRYVENWSLALDVLILWKTFSAVVRADGAY